MLGLVCAKEEESSEAPSVVTSFLATKTEMRFIVSSFIYTFECLFVYLCKTQRKMMKWITLDGFFYFTRKQGMKIENVLWTGH